MKTFWDSLQLITKVNIEYIHLPNPKIGFLSHNAGPETEKSPDQKTCEIK